MGSYGVMQGLHWGCMGLSMGYIYIYELQISGFYLDDKPVATEVTKEFVPVLPKPTTLHLGSIPHPVMGTTRYYCRFIKVLLTPY